MICVLHAHFVNTAKPGSYEQELNKMLAINGTSFHTCPKRRAIRGIIWGGNRIPNTKSVVPEYQEEEEREELVPSFAMNAGSLADISVEEKTSKGVHDIV